MPSITSKQQLYSPKNDVLFKLIFGRDCNKDLLISLINAALYGKVDPVMDVEYIQSEKEIGLITPGSSRVDVSCTTKHNDNFIVEMQQSKRNCFIERCMVYNCSVYASQKEKKYFKLDEIKDQLVEDTDNIEETGNTKQTTSDASDNTGYENIHPSRLIGILDYIQFPNRPRQYLSHYRFIEDNSLDRDIDPMPLTFIELKKMSYDDPDNIKTDLEKWMLFFQKANNMTIDSFLKYVGRNKEFEKAYQQLEYNSYNQEQRKAIEQAEEGISIKIGELKAARDEGAKTAAIESATRMIQDGLSDDIILKYIDISQKELDILRKSK